ncbi:unnamed protein product [Diamesa serratosioi]
MTSALSIQAWPGGVEQTKWLNNQQVEWQQQPTGWEQPNAGWKQPAEEWKQPQVVQTGWQQPNAGWKQPAEEWKQPQVVQTGWQQPNAGWKQPAEEWKQPQVVQPTVLLASTTGWQDPNAGWRQPAPVWHQPAEGWKKPEIVQEPTVLIEPTTGGQKPTTGWQQTDGGNNGNYPDRKPTITKHIYVHVPQPEKEEILEPRWIKPSQPNKHYKIIFIKTPDAPKLGPIKIPAQPQDEEKTLVYVLSKKPDTQQDIIVEPQVQTKPSKPEVFFIKYKTKKEQAKYGPPEHVPSPPKTDYGVPSHS